MSDVRMDTNTRYIFCVDGTDPKFSHSLLPPSRRQLRNILFTQIVGFVLCALMILVAALLRSSDYLAVLLPVASVGALGVLARSLVYSRAARARRNGFVADSNEILTLIRLAVPGPPSSTVDKLRKISDAAEIHGSRPIRFDSTPRESDQEDSDLHHYRVRSYFERARVAILALAMEYRSVLWRIEENELASKFEEAIIGLDRAYGQIVSDE